MRPTSSSVEWVGPTLRGGGYVVGDLSLRGRSQPLFVIDLISEGPKTHVYCSKLGKSKHKTQQQDRSVNHGPTHPTILPRVATDYTADTQRRVHHADNRLGHLTLRRRAPCGRP